MTEPVEPITPDMLLAAYANGYFPMALEKDDPELYWFSPEERGVLPIEGFNIPRGLKRAMKAHPYKLTVDRDFGGVIGACARLTAKRKDTWINQTVIDLYGELHRLGQAHSVEAWQGKELVGGLYGVSLGGAFFGESMFSTAPEASKLALVALIGILKDAGYKLLDTQYVNTHLTQFGVQAVPKRHYLSLLQKALETAPNPSARFPEVAGQRGLA
jgi:leucyl/phenylalanyl-tRNA--protein transferase